MSLKNLQTELLFLEDIESMLSWNVDDLEKKCLQSLYGNADEKSKAGATTSRSTLWKIPNDCSSNPGLNDENLLPFSSADNMQPSDDHPFFSSPSEEVSASPPSHAKNYNTYLSASLDGFHQSSLKEKGCALLSFSYADNSYIDFSKVDDRNVNGTSCVYGEKLHAIMEFGGAKCKEHIGFVASDSRLIGKAKCNARNNFPRKLMMLIDDNTASNIIFWLPHGRAFVLKDSKRFISHVYPRYFKDTVRYKAFVRMLNMWGFKRITNGPDRGAYYHQLFLKGMPNLVSKMQHIKKQYKREMPLAYPKDVPNFYELSRVRPLISCRMN